MAIYLDPAANGRVDFGDIATIGGQTGFTICFTVAVTAAPASSRYLVSKWGSSGATQGFIVQMTDTDEIGYAFQNSGIYGRKTTTLNMAASTTYRVVIKMAFGAVPASKIFINGTDTSHSQWSSFTGTPLTMPNVSSSFQIGHNTANSTDGIEGNYSNVGLWATALADATCDGISDGSIDPATLDPTSEPAMDGLFYTTLTSTTDPHDDWFSYTGTVTGGTTVGGGGGGGSTGRNRIVMVY